METCRFFAVAPETKDDGYAGCTCRIESALCCALVGPRGSAKTSMALQYACNRVAECGGDSVALFLCQRSRALVEPRFPRLYAEGTAPSRGILQRVLVKYVQSDSQIRDCLARAHMLPSPPCAIVLDDWSTVTAFSAERSVAATLALLGDTVHWASAALSSRAVAPRSCTAVVVLDAPSPATERWLPLSIDIAQSQTLPSCFGLTVRDVSNATPFTFEIKDGGFFLKGANTDVLPQHEQVQVQ